jgi:ubiquinone/menaquinone biosynthesis C-methylase UbiE
MSVEKWSKKGVMVFHEKFKGGYAGDVSAPEIFRLSRKYVKGRVLDVGSGSGALVKLFPAAVGVDLVPKHLNSVKGDVANLPFKDGSFGTVFCTELLEHLCDEDLEAGLDEIRRVLSPGGI